MISSVWCAATLRSLQEYSRVGAVAVEALNTIIGTSR